MHLLNSIFHDNKKNLHFTRPLLIFAMMGALSSCMTVRDGNELADKLQKAEAEIQRLRNEMDAADKTFKQEGKLSQSKLMNMSTSLEEHELNLQRINGELDSLRVGVMTGELPGREAGQDSVAKRMSDLEERMTKMEEAQIEILSLLEAKGKNAPSKKKENTKKRNPLKSIEELSQAFTKKNYGQVVEDAPALIKGTKNEEDRFKARLLLAQSLFKTNAHREAFLSFNELATKNDFNEKPLVLLRMADSLRMMGEKKSALGYYRDLVKAYPTSPEAAEAKKHLANEH